MQNYRYLVNQTASNTCPTMSTHCLPKTKPVQVAACITGYMLSGTDQKVTNQEGIQSTIYYMYITQAVTSFPTAKGVQSYSLLNERVEHRMHSSLKYISYSCYSNNPPPIIVGGINTLQFIPCRQQNSVTSRSLAGHC